MLKMTCLIAAFITVFALNIALLANASEKGDPAKGREVFAAKCTPCHGLTGHGDGPGAASLAFIFTSLVLPSGRVNFTLAGLKP